MNDAAKRLDASFEDAEGLQGKDVSYDDSKEELLGHNYEKYVLLKKDSNKEMYIKMEEIHQENPHHIRKKTCFYKEEIHELEEEIRRQEEE